MKKWVWIGISIAILLGSMFYLKSSPYMLTLTETRVHEPSVYYIALDEEQQFNIVFTHSIHLTDVVERYKVLEDSTIQLLSMQYEDVAIGMPGYAEEGQTLIYEDGVYTLSYEEAILPHFTLYIGDVDAALTLVHEGHEINLKEQLQPGKSYVVQAKRLTFYERLKGVELK